MTMKEYDGTLAIACIILAVMLNALQINFIADGLASVSGQDYLMAVVYAIVVTFGLMFSMFAGHRLSSKHLSQRYSFALALVASLLTGGMAGWSLSHTAGIWSAKWCFGIFIGATIPGQTVVLCKLTNGMLDLAGSGWWDKSMVRKLFAVVLPARPSHVPSQTEAPIVTTEAELVDALAAPAVVQKSNSVDPQLPRSGATSPPAAEIPLDDQELEAISEPEIVEPIEESYLILRNDGVATISLSGERLSVCIGANLSKSRWKDLHSELRRIPFVVWDSAEKGEDQAGNSARMLEGVIKVPPPKGKKNRKKMENAKQRHLEAVSAEIRRLVTHYSNN